MRQTYKEVVKQALRNIRDTYNLLIKVDRQMRQPNVAPATDNPIVPFSCETTIVAEERMETQATEAEQLLPPPVSTNTSQANEDQQLLPPPVPTNLSSHANQDQQLLPPPVPTKSSRQVHSTGDTDKLYQYVTKRRTAAQGAKWVSEHCANVIGQLDDVCPNS